MFVSFFLVVAFCCCYIICSVAKEFLAIIYLGLLIVVATMCMSLEQPDIYIKLY